LIARLGFFLCCLLGAVTVAAAEPGTLWAPQPSAHIKASPISELSGIVKSNRRADLYWVHNDSGDEARLFAITATGESVLPTYSRFTYYGDVAEAGKTQWQGFPVLYSNNVDWEDIAVDRNYLYLADTGNNGNARRDLMLYLVSEIDPTASTRSAVIQALPLVYPDQTAFPPERLHFDSESLFVVAGAPYLITKHRRSAGLLREEFEQGATLYRLDTRYTDKNNILTKVDTHPTLLAATGADLSPDGNTLAVVSMDALWLFNKPADGSDRWLSSEASRYPFERDALKQLEAVTWIDNQTLLLGNEQSELFRIPLAELPEAKAR
jgi:hypothetical protein